ncbi:MAG: hypothetical protein Tsb002_27880 [Wenzhouxiangellaceae bacterium]
MKLQDKALLELNMANEEITMLDDEMLQSISGGCTSSCGGPRPGTTILFSCVPPGQGCP